MEDGGSGPARGAGPGRCDYLRRLMRRPMPPIRARSAPNGAPRSGSPVLARETPAVDALTPPVAVAEDALTCPLGVVFDAFCPAAPAWPDAPPPMTVGALTLVPVLGALPVVGALVLVLGADCC
jgi:hypothetical protein